MPSQTKPCWNILSTPCFSTASKMGLIQILGQWKRDAVVPQGSCSELICKSQKESTCDKLKYLIACRFLINFVDLWDRLLLKILLNFLEIWSLEFIETRDFQYSVAVVCRFFTKYLFFKILQNSQDHTCAKVSFLIKL